MTNRSKLHESIVSTLLEILKREDKNPSHFIHEIKIKGYNVIGVFCVSLSNWWDSTKKNNNGQFSAPYTTTITYNKSMNTVNYLWVAICSKCSQFPPTAWKKYLFLRQKLVYLISCFRNCTIFGISAKWIWSLIYLFTLISINESLEKSIVPNCAFQQSLKVIDIL